ncbi:MAG: polysaccharide pyruvyl transferase CsaB [Clostridiales bacterium]|jgi:polysaccharide pyruvyl transferase CsaB|nr:polysaccharide pyruvyl transferase CsaB [Clostridiales bacterium]
MKTDFKVLMALQGMEIGGAETHVLELSKSLKSRGADVYVASKGGAYVPELEAAGIRHFTVPLNSRGPRSMIASYFALERIIRENGIKLVHAHARIPAFLCGMLQKRLHFRFVTTCHCEFYISPLLKLLSNWGEKQLAVSEDLKTYLASNYGVPEDGIDITINGIDTEKFSPGTDGSRVALEFGLAKDKRRIVYVSRLDKGNCSVAYALLQCVEELHQLVPKIELVVVGGGTEAESLRKAAQNINARLETKAIIMTGPRVDVNRIVANAEIAVAISRAALEAMSSGKRVILAGNFGSLGIFGEDKLPSAIATNFTCRDCAPFDQKSLRTDILTLLRMPTGEADRLSRYGRDIVRKLYDSSRMADDALALYERVLKSSRPVDAVVSGYYGFNNNGDDAVLKALLDDLRALKPDLNAVVLSRRPGVTAREYGVSTVFRFNVFKLSRLMAETNVLVSGGGSLIQDITSTQSLLYYLYVIRLAKRRGAAVMMYANGIGPVRREKNRRRAGRTLNAVDLITLRDADSAREAEALGVTVPESAVTADAAFGILPRDGDADAAAAKLTELGLKPGGYFLVSIRSWKYLKGVEAETFEREISEFCEYCKLKHGLAPLFIPMQPENDETVSRRVAARVRGGGAYLGARSVGETLELIRGAAFVVGMRLHSVIYAISVGTPPIGVVYDPKVRAVMEGANQPYCVDARAIDGEKLRACADYIIFNRAAISSALMSYAERSRVAARRNAEMAVGLMERDMF